MIQCLYRNGSSVLLVMVLDSVRMCHVAEVAGIILETEQELAHAVTVLANVRFVQVRVDSM